MNTALVVPSPYYDNLKNGSQKVEARLGDKNKYKNLSEVIITNGQEEFILKIKSITHHLSLDDLDSLLWQSFLWNGKKIQEKGGIILFTFY